MGHQYKMAAKTHFKAFSAGLSLNPPEQQFLSPVEALPSVRIPNQNG